MSDLYNCIKKLNYLATKLHGEAYDLEKIARVLKEREENNAHKSEIKKAKKWARGWMKHDI